VILDGLGVVLLAFSVAFLAPIWAGVWYHEVAGKLFMAYGIPIVICLVLGLLFRYYFHEQFEQVRTGEALVLVSLGWLVIAAIGAIPFLALGVLKSPIDAFFESMSGFTTTGATVIVGLEWLPKSILMWRATIQWVGGMGIIVLSVAVLSRFLGGRMKPLMMQAEMPGHQVARMAPRLAQTARLLWAIYILFTVTGIAALAIVGHYSSPRMGLFDAMCHVMTALPTGGFSSYDASVGHWNSPAIEFVLIVIMLLGGTNFVLHYKALGGDWRAFLRDPEFRFFMLVIAFGVVFITGDLAVRNVYTLGESFRYSSFHVVSVITTTGFASDNFNLWPVSSQLMLLLLMLVGSMMGSTGGGLKIARTLIILKSIRVMLLKSIHTRGVFYVKIGNVKLSDEQVSHTTTYVMSYLLIIGGAALLVTMTGADLVTSISATVSCMGNVGPGLAIVGPATTYATLTGAAKLVLSLLMWIGRLEILGCLLLFTPSSWKE